MCRKLNWNDVLDSLPPHDRAYHAEASKKMYDEAVGGNIDESKKIADHIQEWEIGRWNLAESNMAAASSTIMELVK